MDTGEEWSQHGNLYLDPQGKWWTNPEVAGIFRIFHEKARKGEDIFPLSAEETERFAQIADPPSEARVLRFYELYKSLNSSQLRKLLGESRSKHLRIVE